MGSAAAARLAARGANVLGLEQFALGHDLGASSGRTRIIRRAYFESPRYVPLLERAYALWHELEAATATTLLDLCGLLVVGPNDGDAPRGVALASERFGIPVEMLSPSQLVRRWPQFCLGDGEIALFEAGAGVVFPERAIAAMQAHARECGATLRGDAPVTSWEAHGRGMRVHVADASAIDADRVVVTAGPWLGEIARSLALPLVVQRNVQLWFEPATAGFGREDFPAFFLERAGLPGPLYGFPDFGDGLKAALHGAGEATRADDLDRSVRDEDERRVRAALSPFLPGAAGALRSGKACMYALTPDAHFAIGSDPRDANVVVAGGFSGHGFKFAPVVGEIVAELVLDGRTAFDIEFLGLHRLLGA